VLPLPARSARSARPAARRPRWWLELLIVAWLAWIYDILTNFAPLRARAAIAHAWGIWHAEQSVHLDPELALNRWLAAHHTVGVIASYYYDNAHFIVTFGLLGWLWWRRADIYRPLRSSLALVNVIAFAVFWLYPLAPPRLLGSVGFSDVVASSHTFGSWHTGALASSADQFAAMPSLHIAWAVWCGIVLWQLSRRRLVRAAALLYPCVTTAVVLATGNHFLFDVLGGLAALALALALVRIAPFSLAALAPRSKARVGVSDTIEPGAWATIPRA
jgi:PAP2 superfamily